MIDYLAKRKEEKFIREVVRLLSQRKFSIPVRFEAMPCHIDPRFMHLGIIIHSEIGVEHHHHMCFLDGYGNWCSTKSELQTDDYRGDYFAGNTPQLRAGELVNSYYRWTLLSNSGSGNEENWKVIYPGIPFIGDNVPIPPDFEPPSRKEQFAFLSFLKESGQISYAEYELKADFLERLYDGHGRIGDGKSWYEHEIKPDPWHKPE